ncbi:DUF5067 domain-containing protein [Enterococcus termitis]|uniref:DUF5067 domain-containing protein n=1 Tax=Enterococcus termitis TaxID=332950 RepID=A0A1E5GIA5_9ENTE|nr:DUF5067 domain-containing protein [Enterococcus termitis]OEG12432.1 DUF5067 domain-containing protein [Enterococcus termitis]
MYKKRIMIPIVLLLIVFSGCSAKLADKEESFKAKGIEYTIQLPSTWETTTDFKVKYSNEAVFGAQDTKSNSTLVVMGERKETVELDDDFGKRMRKELKTQYNYDKESEIYMKEFKIGKYKGFKYTLDTMFEKRSTWLHLYYIETEHGFLQLNYYSANDGGHEKRAEIIDQSARSVKEIADSGNESSAESEEVVFKNETVSIELTGVMNLEGEGDKKLLALRYTVKNTSEKTAVTAGLWDEAIQVTQQGKELKEGKLPKSNTILDIPKLIEQKKNEIQVGKTGESVSLYELTDTSDVTLVPSKDLFVDAKEVPIVVAAGKEEDE